MSNLDRRYRTVYAPVDVLCNILNGDLTVVDFDAPSDARVVNVHYAYDQNAIAIVLHSAEFAIVPLGDIIPPLHRFGLKLSRREARP